MITHNRKILTWVVCLLFMTGITLSSSAGIICLGDDGHAQVESLCRPACNDSDLACPQEETDHDHDDCTDCVDLPLIQELLSQRYLNPVRSEVSLYISSLVAIRHAPADSSADCFSGRREAEARLDRGSDLLSVTVLRC